MLRSDDLVPVILGVFCGWLIGPVIGRLLLAIGP